MFRLIVSIAASNKRALLIPLLENRVYGIAAPSITALISAAVLRYSPSLSPGIGRRRLLRLLETYSFSTEASPHLPTHL